MALIPRVSRGMTASIGYDKVVYLRVGRVVGGGLPRCVLDQGVSVAANALVSWASHALKSLQK